MYKKLVISPTEDWVTEPCGMNHRLREIILVRRFVEKTKSAYQKRALH
jgi:hypothetical protein